MSGDRTRPVTAPVPVTRAARVVRQAWWAAPIGWVVVLAAAAWPLALVERAFGLGAAVGAQAWVLPVGLVGSAASWMTYRRFAPRRGGDGLVVSPDRLEYRPGRGGVEIVDAAGVGLVDVVGDPVSGNHAVVVYDHGSRVRAVWRPRWAGWSARRVVRVLRDAGYPAHIHNEIYDGRFQAQTPGRPPRVAD